MTAMLTIKNAVQMKIAPAIISAPFFKEVAAPIANSAKPKMNSTKDEKIIQELFFIKKTSLLNKAIYCYSTIITKLT